MTAPPGGHWEYGGTDAPYVAARHWISGGSRPSEHEALADVAKFAGQVAARVRPALEEMRASLVTFTDPEGRELFDLPSSPRPDAGTPAPVRLLPRYDEMLIAYQHRDRVIAAPYRPRMYAKNGIIEASLLVDGFVAGSWSLERTKTDAVVRIAPFRRLGAKERADALAEGERLAAFLAPAARTTGARVR